MPPDRTHEVVTTAVAWTRSDWITLAALAAAAVPFAWSLAALWRRRRRSDAVRSADVLEFALSAARYSWAAERRFTESWRLMPTGRRPEPMEPPPMPEAIARSRLVELCRVRSALSELHRLFSSYAAAPHDDGAAGQDRPEWWRDRYEKAIHGACGAVRSAVADSAFRRFPHFSVTSRQLETALGTAQTSRR